MCLYIFSIIENRAFFILTIYLSHLRMELVFWLLINFISENNKVKSIWVKKNQNIAKLYYWISWNLSINVNMNIFILQPINTFALNDAIYRKKPRLRESSSGNLINCEVFFLFISSNHRKIHLVYTNVYSMFSVHVYVQFTIVVDVNPSSLFEVKFIDLMVIMGHYGDVIRVIRSMHLFLKTKWHVKIASH